MYLNKKSQPKFLRFGVSNMNHIEVGKKHISKILDKIGDMPINSLKDYAIKDELPEQIYEINKFLPQLFQDDSEKSILKHCSLHLKQVIKMDFINLLMYNIICYL